MTSEAIRVGRVEIRPHEHLVLCGGQPVELTSREYDIALKLAEHPGWVLTAEQLASTDESGDFSPDSVSVHVSHLRHKFASAGEPGLFETVRGVGYRMHAGPAQDDEPAVAPAAGPSVHEALWRLEEAVFRVEHEGTGQQRDAVSTRLDEARRDIDALLEG